MSIHQIKQRIRSARLTSLDFIDTTPPEIQSALMDLASIAEHLVEQSGAARSLPSWEVSDMNLVTRKGAMDYEIRGSWWSGFVSWNWAQWIAAWWLARKVLRKYRRYSMSMIESSKQNLTAAQTRR